MPPPIAIEEAKKVTATFEAIFQATQGMPRKVKPDFIRASLGFGSFEVDGFQLEPFDVVAEFADQEFIPGTGIPALPLYDKTDVFRALFFGLGPPLYRSYNTKIEIFIPEPTTLALMALGLAGLG